MKRFHDEIALMRRRAASPQAKARELGRFRKHHPGDCGRANCGLCHGKRWYRGADRQRRERDAFRLENCA